MLNVYLLRHGETVWNADGNRYCGLTDIALTAKGTDQALKAKSLLAGVHFDAVYSSPLERAFRTAGLVCGAPGSVRREPLLTEVDFGAWEGKTREEFIREDPGLWERWAAAPDTTRAGGTGETAGEVVARVDRFFNSASRLHAGGTILVVAHNTVNRFYLAWKLGMPLRNYRRLVQHNAAVTSFTLDHDGELALNRLNCS